MDIKKQIEDLYIQRNYLFLKLDSFEKKQKLLSSSGIKNDLLLTLIDEVKKDLISLEFLINQLTKNQVGLK